MRTAAILVLLSVGRLVAQEETKPPQDPAKPPQQEPAPKPAEAPTPTVADPTKADPTKADPTKADPIKMASPKPGNPKPAAQSVVDDKTFKLGPEDQIDVFVFQGQEFTGAHMIRPDGKITVNLVGDVQAAGFTPEELAKEIKEKIKAYVNDPDVTVKVTAVKSKKYLINGEVNRPGEYPLVVPMRVFQALANAGGFKDFANQKKITIIHEDNTRSYFNYKEVLAGKKLDQNIWLKPGDIIVVK